MNTEDVNGSLFRRAGRLLGGAAAVFAVTCAAVMPVADAQAAIVASGPVNLPVPVSSAGLYINVVTGAFGTSAGAVAGYDINPWGTTSLRIWGNSTAGNGVVSNLGSSTNFADNLPLGTLVGAASTFTVASTGVETTGATSFLLGSSANYIGFSLLNEATGAVNYGWMQFSLGTSYIGTDRAVVAWAYENTGASIAVGAGAVPEPGSVALMLAGGLGLLGFKRLRPRG